MGIRVNDSVSNRHNLFMHIPAVIVWLPLVICKVVASNNALAAVYLVLQGPSITACEVLVNIVQNIRFVVLVGAVRDILYGWVGVKQASYDCVNRAVYHWHKGLDSAGVIFLYADIAVEFPVILPHLVVVLLGISP